MISKQETAGLLPSGPPDPEWSSLLLPGVQNGGEETREKEKVGAKDELAGSTSSGTAASTTPPPKLWDNIKTQALSAQVSIPHPAHLPCQPHCTQPGRRIL